MRTITIRFRCLAAICFLFITALTMHAQESVPLKMSYQAVVRDGTNNLLANKTIGMRISIIRGSANGSLVYSETHLPITNSNGLVSIIIGDGHSTTGAVAMIDWSQGPFFVKTEIDITGGSNYSIESTTQLLSVPFALYAEKAGNGFDGMYQSLEGKPSLAEVATSGDYEDLANKPAFADVATSGEYEDLTNKPAFAAVATTGNYEDLANRPTLSEVAISGDYAVLANKPVLSTVATSGNYKDLSDAPVLAEVATTGSYKNLKDVPTKVSELENDAKYLVNEKQRLTLEGSSLSITDENGAAVSTVNLPTNTTGGVTDYEQLTNKPQGTKDGDLLYWNESQKKWNVLRMGLEGQILSVSDGKLNWTEPSFIINTEAYEEGEVFYKNGEAEGIIVKSDKMSRTGLLLSLKETTNNWGPKEFIQTSDSVNGANNMAVIAAMNDWRKYPAFADCRNEGSNWYLPSTEELKLIQQNFDKLNTELTKAGGTPLSEDFYWSSTSRSYKSAYGIAFKEASIKDMNSAIQADEKYIVTEKVQSSTGADSLIFVRVDIPLGERIEARKDTALIVRAVRQLSWSELTSKPSQGNSYKVGDIYYASDKTTALGIVYQTSENGAHGRVMSIKESNEITWEQAEKWSSNIGPSWVIPTEKEWKDIAGQKKMINEILGQKQLTLLNAKNAYWSSSEDTDGTKAISIRMPDTSSDGSSYTAEPLEKTGTALVRAIMEF